MGKEKIKFGELLDNKDWKKAVIVFTADSFNKEYSEESRSYEFSIDNKYFNGMMIGNSLYANCLDGTDDGVRLDYYFGDWKIEYCYIVE